MDEIFIQGQARITLVTFEEGNRGPREGRGGTLHTLLDLSSVNSTNASPV